MDSDAWLAVSVPVAALAVALLSARRLVTDDPLSWPPIQEGASVRPLALAALLLPVAVFCAAFFLDRERLVLWVASAATVGLGWRARDLSRRRRAARAVLAAQIPLAAVMPLLAGIPDRGGSTILHPSFLLLAAVVPAAILTRPLVKSWTGPVLTILAAVPMVVWLAVSAGPSSAPRPTEMADWLRRFDRPVNDMLAWDTFGRTVAWLRNVRGLTLDLRIPEQTVREALRRGEELHPTTLNGVLLADLLDAAELASFSGSSTLNRARMLLEGSGPIVFTANTPAEVRLLVARGEVNAEQRERLVERLAQSWGPALTADHLEEASRLCRLLTHLDAEARIQEQRAGLHALLERAWCREAPGDCDPGGFTLNADGGAHPSDAAATWHALEIIRHVGAPASIDLSRTRRYLRGAIRRRTKSDQLDPQYSDHQATWMRFEAEHDASPSAARRLEDAGALLGAGAFLLLSAYLLVRARPARLQPPVPRNLPPWAASAEAEGNKDRPL